ncbi:hypothetical protein C0J52_11345 [Blattella germanica]|nr:hypothetical protein C0J52_11345 [Blattella germanica]
MCTTFRYLVMFHIPLLFITACLRFSTCNVLENLTATSPPMKEINVGENCINIISNKSKSLDCLLLINDPEYTTTEEIKKADCHEYYDLATDFFANGDLNVGYKIVTACRDTYNSLESCREFTHPELEELHYDPEDLNAVCEIYQEAYFIAMQQDVCFKMAIKIKQISIREQSIYTTEFIRGNYVTEIKKMYNSAMNLKNTIAQYNLSHILSNTFITNITGDEIRIIVEEGMEFNKEIDEYRTLLYYIYGPVDITLFVLGFITNVALILIFVRFKEIRTTQNMLLLNLAIGDIMNLFSNIMTAYVVEIIFENQFTYFGDLTCKIIACCQFVSVGLSVYAVVFLSIQRYIFIKSPGYVKCGASVKTIVTLNIIAVWIFSLCFSTPVVILTISDDYGICFIPKDFDPAMWNLLYIGVLPTVTVAFFYTIAARQIAQSAKNIPGECQTSERTRKARNKSAGVLIALSGVFAFSYLPYTIYLYLLHSKYIIPPPYLYEYLLYKLTFLNPVINPLALYFGSETFRRHFNKCCSMCSRKSMRYKPSEFTLQSKETLFTH